MSRVTFTFNGKQVEAEEGQSVAAALLAEGEVQLGRSMKYRRPRGLYCATGSCPNCLLRVDGVSFTRSCMTEAREGMVVEDQKPQRIRKFDPLRAVDFVDFPFPLGFQYRYFKRSNKVYELWEGKLREIAGHASMPTTKPALGVAIKKSADLLVIGAGPAGIGAATAAAEAGLRVVLVSRWWGTDRPELMKRRLGFIDGPLREATAGIDRLAGLEVFAPATAFAIFDDTTMVDHEGRLIEVVAPSIVLATGAHERGLVFDGNDLPGVMLASAASRLIRRDGVKPGRRAVVVTADDDAYDVAVELDEAGLQVVAALDTRAAGPILGTERLRERGIRHATGVEVLGTHGFGRVRGVNVRINETDERLDCDLLAISGGWQLADELHYQATSRGDVLVEGDRATPIDWQALDEASPNAIYSVGAAAGAHESEQAFLEGRLAGLHAAGSGDGDSTFAQTRAQLATAMGDSR
jgi:NADPH-dependent 2,4-dienoyl-CoA reductase/sulfur reductase-like enzyme